MIVDLTRAEAVTGADEVTTLYAAAFGYPPSVTRQFSDAYTRCMREYHGARLLLARVDGASVGFAFGFTFERGHWWPEQIGPTLQAADHADWMQDAFELAELVVAPEHQGRGTGAMLLHHLLHTTRHQRVLLATAPTNPARRLYRRAGFVELLPDFRYGDSGPAAVIMGRDRDRTGPPASPQRGVGAGS